MSITSPFFVCPNCGAGRDVGEYIRLPDGRTICTRCYPRFYFFCSFCRSHVPLPYRDSLASGLVICSECKADEAHLEPLAGVKESDVQAYMLRSAGYTVRETAELLRVSTTTVKTWTRSVGIKVLGLEES